MFGKYLTDEPYINTKDDTQVDHVAIIITNGQYKINNRLGLEDNGAAYNSCDRILRLLKDGPFDNKTINERLSFSEKLRQLKKTGKDLQNELKEFKIKNKTLNEKTGPDSEK